MNPANAMPQNAPKAHPLKSGRKFAGAGKRAAAPIPFLHSAPHNAGARENAGRLNPSR
jgi:hypothetical protein